jgi:hypothetical protein
MKHLLTGVAMAAALAIAAPVWAQSTPAPAAPGKPAAAPATPAAAKPMAMKKPMHHWHHRMAAGDSVTEQLNAQELQRIQGGGPAPAPAPMAPGGNNPTSGSAGPFAPAGSAPPPPPPGH